MKKLLSIFDRMEVILAIVAACLIVAVGLSICYEVVMRYFFNSPTKWSVEVSRFALVYMAFLAAAWVLKRDAHVTVDLLINRFSPRTQAVLNMINSFIAAIVYLIVVWYGIKVTAESIQIGYRLETELRTPQWLVLIPIPFGSFFFFVRFLRKAFDCLATWKAPEPPKEGEEGFELKPQL